jgi:hypothetical protein
LKGRGHLENLGVDGKLILECIVRKIGWEVVDWITLAEVRDQWRGPCEHSNEPADSIKDRGFIQ